MADEAPNTGDTPLLEGVSLFEFTDVEIPPAAGDEVKQGEVHLVENHDAPTPTAGELREAGYQIEPQDAPDDAVGFVAFADQPVPVGKVNLYQEEPPYPGGPAPEEPTMTTVEPETPVSVSNPTSEQQGARTDEEREAADQAAEVRAEQDDPSYQQGFQAYVRGEARSSNPNDGRTLAGKAWARGWNTAESQGVVQATAPVDPGSGDSPAPAPEPPPEDPDAGPPVEGV